MRKLSILLILVVLFGCGEYKNYSIGDWNNIIVISGNDDWDHVSESYKEVFERKIYTPQEEIIYKIYHPQLEEFERFKTRRFIVVTGTLESEGNAGVFINQLLTTEIKDMIAAGNHIFVKENEWAKDQAVIFVIAPDIETLNMTLGKNADRLFNSIDRARNNLLGRIMFEKEEQTDLSREIYENFDFGIRVQHDYFMKTDSLEKYVLLRRYDPARLITVHWIDTTGFVDLDADWVVEKRSEVAEVIMDNRQHNPAFTEVKNSDFLGFMALEINGLWEKREDIMGGPFTTYMFYDDIANRIYMIDLTLYAPEFSAEKEPLIRQMEIIARTFSPGKPSYID